MKSYSLVIVLLICLVTQVYAQSQDKRSRIKFLLSLMQQDSLVLKQMDATMARSKAMSRAMTDTLRVKIDSVTQKRQDEFSKKVLQKTRENALRLINEDMVAVYD